MTYIARFRTLCRICGEHINPGDRIAWDDALVAIHDECDDATLEPELARDGQCPTCHLTLPLSGICDECED